MWHEHSHASKRISKAFAKRISPEMSQFIMERKQIFLPVHQYICNSCDHKIKAIKNEVTPGLYPTLDHVDENEEEMEAEETETGRQEEEDHFYDAEEEPMTHGVKLT